MSELITEASTPVATSESSETVVAAPSPVAKEIDLSSQFAEIARRERGIRAEQAKAKAENEAEKQRWVEELKGDFKNRKFDKYGLSASELTDALLGVDPEPVAPEDTTKKELAELKAWREELKRAEEEKEKKQSVEVYQSQVNTVLESDPGSYELLLAHPTGKSLYWDSIVEFYKIDKQIPTDSQLKAIAAAIEEDLFTEGKRLLSGSKFKSKEAEVVQTAVKESKPSTTLSNSMTTQSGFKSKPVGNYSTAGYKASLSPALQQLADRDLLLQQKIKNI